MNRQINPLLLVLLIVPVMFSCVNTRKAIYFDIQKDSIVPIAYQNSEPVITKNDILSITVSSLSPEASALYNEPNRGGPNVPGGYLVNKDGFILFPVIGSIKAEGLTKEQLRDEITKQLADRKLLLDPIVSIRQTNYKITVLGEVAKPGVVTVPAEKISILEAIGFAGDLTLFSNRSNVLVIREQNNQREFKVLNLNSNDIFNSPYFYLKPNDVVYVQPTKTRVASASGTRQWLPTVISLMSFAAVIFSRVLYR